VSATAGIPAEPGPGEIGADQAATLSALEEALRHALSVLPRGVVARCVADALPVEILVEDSVRLHGGKVRKVSVSMPAELIEAVRGRTGAGGFSRYVAEAVDREIQHDLLGDFLDQLDAEHGPLPEDLLEQARREWPDYKGS
jgi:chloramphenicol 3-O-phosphotransferase